MMVEDVAERTSELALDAMQCQRIKPGLRLERQIKIPSPGQLKQPKTTKDCYKKTHPTSGFNPAFIAFIKSPIGH